MAETNTMDVIFVDYLLPGEPEDAEKHHVTLKEFLALPQDQLTEQNQKIQKALGQLYKLNDRKPPLFHSFPERKKPLVISCKPIEGNFAAHYVSDNNEVELEKSTLASTELNLLDTFAHELKHAEQYSEELHKMDVDTYNNDGLAYHQLRYLIEAQAFAFGSYVTYLFQLESSSKEKCQFAEAVYPVLEKHTKGKNIDDFYDIQCEMMKEVLPLIYEIKLYRDEYDLGSPILRKDKGLTAEDIPDSFRFRDKQEAFSSLQDMPRKARTLEGIARQYRQDNSEIIDALGDSYSAENLKQLVEEKFKSGEISSEGLLFVVKETFTSNGYNPEDAELTKEKLNFFLDLKVDGKPFMQEKDILRLLDGAHISDRKDVEEAIQEYQKKHPNDMRFLENNGLLGATIGKGKRFAYMMNGLNKKRVLDEQAKSQAKFYRKEIRSGSTDNLRDLIKLNLYEDALSFNVLLGIITDEFTQPAEENISDEHFKNSKKMLDFFLDLQVDGKPLMQEKDILRLLDGARISDRKDVEEAVQEYQKEHPDDMRFPKNNGLLGATVGKGKRFAYKTVDKLNELSSQLNEFHLPSSDERRLQQLRIDSVNRGIKDDPEFVKWFVRLNLDNKSLSPGNLLKIITVGFTRPAEENILDQQIQNSKVMLKFFLGLRVNGKILMQGKDILKLLESARASGRKDVEEAIQEYQKDHPNDMRFSEKMFEFNRRDKVAEFVKRQERKAAKVKFAVENASKKGATVINAAVTKKIGR